MTRLSGGGLRGHPPGANNTGFLLILNGVAQDAHPLDLHFEEIARTI
jgi:hypothetical protein